MDTDKVISALEKALENIGVVGVNGFEALVEYTSLSGQIEFYIDDTLEATHSTNLPATSTELSMYFAAIARS